MILLAVTDDPAMGTLEVRAYGSWHGGRRGFPDVFLAVQMTDQTSGADGQFPFDFLLIQSKTNRMRRMSSRSVSTRGRHSSR